MTESRLNKLEASMERPLYARHSILFEQVRDEAVEVKRKSVALRSASMLLLCNGTYLKE
jgi:hypothetical protein